MKPLLTVFLLLGVAGMPQAASAEPETAQTVERIPVRMESDEDTMVRELAGDLRCAVCQSESVADSNSSLARSMRDLIREQVRLGKSRDEIHDYFVSKYGEYILMEPRKSGANWILWLLPFVLLGIGAATILMRSRKTMPPAGEPGPGGPAGGDSENRALIDSLREPSPTSEKQ